MIKIIRKPSNSEYNRESIEITLPNDSNPHEVSSFFNRFFKMMFEGTPGYEEMAKSQEEEEEVSRSIGFSVEDEDDTEEDI